MTSSYVFYRYERLEIPLEILPYTGISDVNLQALNHLPVIMEKEELDSYQQSLEKEQDLLTSLHNGGGKF